MRIGIDARMCGTKQGGLGRYVEQLITNLLHIDQSNEYILFFQKDYFDFFQHPASNYKKILADIHWYGWREQFFLPALLKKEKVDLMHFPHWNVPLNYNKPFVVTIHDLLLKHYPTREASTLGPIGYWFKNIVFNLVLRHATNKSKQIIAPSEFTRSDIIATLKILPDKINVTLLAPFNDDNGTTNNHQINSVNYFNNLGIVKPYVLYVGVAYPHKNLPRLLHAWKIFQNKYDNNYQLVLAGKRNYFYDKLIDRMNNQKISDVVITDYVPDQNLPSLYMGASLYVFPSLFEGFGMPPLEAMAYEVPVVSSNTTCLPEILRDAAMYFDPNKTEEMAETIYQGLTCQEIRTKLKSASALLLSNYSWDKTAVETLKIFENAIK